MDAIIANKLTAKQYLDIENAAEFRSEYRDGEMVRVPETYPAHNFLKCAVVGELGMRLKGTRFFTVSTTQRLKVERTNFYTYPDIIILPDEYELDPNDLSTIVNPRVLIEILSPSTEQYDRTIKFDHYRKIDSAREYVLVSQDEPRIERYVRGDDGRWTHDAYTGPEATFSLESVPAKDIPLADIFRGIAFPERAR